MAKDTADYRQYQVEIEGPTPTGDTGLVVHADDCYVTPTGDLILSRKSRAVHVFARGTWRQVYDLDYREVEGPAT
jgi:hypothetical protein